MTRGRVALAVEGAVLVLAIAGAWMTGWLATEAWIDRVRELHVAHPSHDEVRASARVASLYFTLAVLALGIGRGVSVWRSREPIAIPVLFSAAIVALSIGFALHSATVETIGDAALIPTAAPFAQGFFFGSIAAAAILAAPFDLVAVLARAKIAIAAAIVLVFVLLGALGTGPGTSGARINLGPLQPIEAVKPLFVVFLAVYFGERAAKLRWQRDRFLRLRWPRPALLFPAVLALVAIFAALYVIGDLGPVLILAVVFLAMFYAVTRATGWALVSISTVSGLIAIAAMWPSLVNVGRVVTRLSMWRDPWWNGIAHGDQLGEGLWAIAAGGMWGQGLGDAHAPLVAAGKTDLVLATLVEQLGAAGLVAYLASIAALVLSALYVAARARTPERSLLAAGSGVLLAAQWAVIHAGTFGLLPLTGVVVPFLSSGRSSMAAFVAMVALVARVAADGQARVGEGEIAEVQGGARGLAIAVVALFAIGAFSGLSAAVFDAERASAMGISTRLRDGTSITRLNPRLLALASRIRRGSILDRRGEPIAVSAEPGARNYPLGPAMGTLIGVHPSRVLLPRWALERTFDARLRGYGERDDAPDGRRWADLRAFAPLLHESEEDRSARIQAIDADLAARSVQLSIDARLQRAVARTIESRPLAAAAVVIDVDTGQVLARVQVPDYDPNDPSWQARMSEPAFVARFTGAYGAWPDKTGAQGMFQSGSVGKLFTALAAAREGETDRTFECVERDADGPFFTRPGWPRPIHDHHRDRNHGRVELVEAIGVSCNVYFAQLALELGPAPLVSLHDDGLDIGYGGRFDPGAPGTRQLASTGFGQGALAMSATQAARLVAAIGGGGVYRRCAPSMELGARCAEVALLEEPRALAPILAGMAYVMSSGTGRSLSVPDGVRVYGKTGTADVRGFAGEEPFGIARGRTAAPHSWFVALAEPIDAPEGQPSWPGRLAIAVVVPRGGTGAATAGPIAMQIVAAARELGYLGGLPAR